MIDNETVILALLSITVKWGNSAHNLLFFSNISEDCPELTAKEYPYQYNPIQFKNYFVRSYPFSPELPHFTVIVTGKNV
jgi:hypothetical protein